MWDTSVCVCVSVWSRVNAEWLQVFELQWGVSGSIAPLFLWEPSSRTVFVMFVSQKWLLFCLIAPAPSAEQDGIVNLQTKTGGRWYRGTDWNTGYLKSFNPETASLWLCVREVGGTSTSDMTSTKKHAHGDSPGTHHSLLSLRCCCYANRPCAMTQCISEAEAIPKVCVYLCGLL